MPLDRRGFAVMAVFPDGLSIPLLAFKQEWRARRELNSLQGRDLYPGKLYTLEVWEVSEGDCDVIYVNPARESAH